MRPGLQATRNVAKALLLLTGFVAALGALGWWLGGFGVGTVFLVVALLMAATMYWYGPRVILASLGAQELTLTEAAVLHTTAEQLAAAAGVGRPKLYILNPFGQERLAMMFSTHPSVEERIQRLRELDPDWRERLRAA